MTKRITLFLYIALMNGSCTAGNHFIDWCSEFKLELEREADKGLAVYDLKFSGVKEGFNEPGTKATKLVFGSEVVWIPFIGDNEVSVPFSHSAIHRKTTFGAVILSFFSDTQYADVRKDLLLSDRNDDPLFMRAISHSELVYRGFEHDLQSLDCRADRLEAERVMAYLHAKAILSVRGSEVWRLEMQNGGLLHIDTNHSVANIVIPNGANLLTVTFKSREGIKIKEWMGVE